MSEGYQIPLKALGQVSAAFGDLHLSHYGAKLQLPAVLDYMRTHTHTGVILTHHSVFVVTEYHTSLRPRVLNYSALRICITDIIIQKGFV